MAADSVRPEGTGSASGAGGGERGGRAVPPSALLHPTCLSGRSRPEPAGATVLQTGLAELGGPQVSDSFPSGALCTVLPGLKGKV